MYVVNKLENITVTFINSPFMTSVLMKAIAIWMKYPGNYFLYLDQKLEWNTDGTLNMYFRLISSFDMKTSYQINSTIYDLKHQVHQMMSLVGCSVSKLLKHAVFNSSYVQLLLHYIQCIIPHLGCTIFLPYSKQLFASTYMTKQLQPIFPN